MTIPGWLAEKPVALNCTLIQVGDQPFPILECKEITTSIPVHTICMIQVHKDEADSQHFNALQDGFAAYLRRLGLDSWRFIDSEWSESFFSGKRKTNIDSCQYFHNVIRIPDKHIKVLLRLGGNAGILVVPKNSSRGIDDRFRVCLLKGLSLEEAKQKLQDVPNHLGIAKLKAGYGIRFERSSYQKARKTLLPDAPSSGDELQQDSDKKFFLLGLPDSFDRCAVRKILREIGWGVGNIQSSGWKTWAVYADSDPPVKDFLLAGTHVVIADGGSSTRRGVFAAGAVRGWKSLASLSAVLVVALKVWGELMSSRQVVFYVDNDGVRDVLISCNTAEPVGCVLLTSVLELEGALAISSWFTRVPSKSNMADSPSRGEITDLIAVQAKHEQVEPIEILRTLGPGV